jgi:hypothetical protein
VTSWTRNSARLWRSGHRDRRRNVGGLVERSYYLDGGINHDIWLSLDGVEQADLRRPRVQGESRNCWVAQQAQQA